LLKPHFLKSQAFLSLCLGASVVRIPTEAPERAVCLLRLAHAFAYTIGMAKKTRISQETPSSAESQSGARPSSLVDTRVIYCGDNLEQLGPKSVSGTGVPKVRTLSVWLLEVERT
jgi:hypothetical protein